MARERNTGIDQLFNDRLENASVAPPAGLWKNINTELENDRLRRKVVYWRFVAAATVLLFLGVGLWTANHFTSVDHNAVRIAVNSTPSTDPILKQVDQLGASALMELPCPENRSGTAFVRNDESNQQTLRKALLKVKNSNWAPIRNASQNLKKNNFRISNAALQSIDSRRSSTVLSSGFDSPAYISTIADMPLPAFTDLDQEDDEDEHLAWVEGQDDKQRKKMRWAMGGSFSPDVAFSTQTPVQPSAARSAAPSLPDDPANSSRSLSDPVATFSTGMRAALDVNERISVRTGVLYTRRSTSKNILSDSYGLQDSYANNFSVDFLEIPVSVQYNLIHGKHFDYYVSTGVSGNLLVGYEQELQTSNGRVASKNVSDEGHLFTPAQANLLVSTGIQYRAFDRMSFNLEPGVRYGFLTSEYAFARQDPVSVSLMTGVNFHF